ncbi:ATP-binding protein [Evansella tamaricis]|uniref:ATP-binding protein n=1 Tax=Evansella tamaricis TaxID=2069301 RepID=A0ABS6JE17_9BACI|nr:ATP-binding protein [Evansella tamaricis]MBU9711097.1 ATP-binding protein [Evansella tamaricis]
MSKTIEEVMTKLQERIRSQAGSSDGSEKDERKYTCEKCKDRGFTLETVEYINPFTQKPMLKGGEVLMTQQAKDCTCLSWRRSERIIKSSEITDQFKNIGFGSFKTEDKPQLIKDLFRCAMDYYTDFDQFNKTRRNSIALLGHPGSGKTHLLTAISNNLMQKKSVSVLYFPYVEGFNDLKDDFGKLEQKLERMKRVDVLFIDDLFKPVTKEIKGERVKVPRATEWQIEQTYAVINHRYLNYKPIMISSELTVDEMFDIDEALSSRIYEMCKDFTVVVKGDRKELNHRLED